MRKYSESGQIKKMPPDSYFDKDYWDDLRRMLKLSQCIASDDPRLKEK